MVRCYYVWCRNATTFLSLKILQLLLLRLLLLSSNLLTTKRAGAGIGGVLAWCGGGGGGGVSRTGMSRRGGGSASWARVDQQTTLVPSSSITPLRPSARRRIGRSIGSSTVYVAAVNGESNFYSSNSNSQDRKLSIDELLEKLQKEQQEQQSQRQDVERFTYAEMLEQHQAELYRLENDGRDESLLHPTTSTATPNPPIFPRQLNTIWIDGKKKATVCSRTIPITPSWNITVWEWQTVAPVIETYWQVEQQGLQVSSSGGGSGSRSSNSRKKQSSSQQQQCMLDPFGLITWPGSVVAAMEMLQHQSRIYQKNVWVIGAGVGVEAQAAAALGAKSVLATDIHPTTMRLLDYGIQQAKFTNVVKIRTWDLFGIEAPPPDIDVIVCADVLYNDKLANQLINRLTQVYQQTTSGASREDGKDDIAEGINATTTTTDSSPTPTQQPPLTLIVDSQRFCHSFEQNLKVQLKQAGCRGKVAWQSRYLPSFTGSGVLVDDDQTYDVKARVMWIGL